jgi:DNA-directed RNA polymerase subunit RPC12/RpoP
MMDEYYCSSCDAPTPLDESDSCGRCERCQEEYPFEEEE